MSQPENDPTITGLPDPARRRLLHAGAGMLVLPLLSSCGDNDRRRDSGSVDPTAPVDPTDPTDPTDPVDPTDPTDPGTPPARKPPRGLHASWTEDPHSTRTLTWFTDGGEDPGSIIEYGPVIAGMTAADIAGTPLPQRAEGAAHATYGVDALTHIATARGLDPALPLRYRVGSADGWSDIRVLPPVPGGKQFRFCHFGDHAQNDASRAVLAGVAGRAPDFFWIAGDLSYANGDQPLWDSYFDMLDPVTSRLPLMTCPGNHENKDGGGDGYRTRFAQPGEGTYYGFDFNNVHFCVSTGGSLVTGVNSSVGDMIAELAALERDLLDAARRRARGEIDFIVFVQHYTIWTNNDGREPANFSLVVFVEHMLLRYDVDLVLVGHDHIYERSKPMAYGLPISSGYVQVTQGGGGQHLYELIAKPAGWAAVSTVRHGFTEFTVDDRVIRATTYAVDDADNVLLPDGGLEVIDTFEIKARERGGLKDALLTLGTSARLVSTDNGFDFEAMMRHTIERNRLHDIEESGHGH